MTGGNTEPKFGRSSGNKEIACSDERSIYPNAPEK